MKAARKGRETKPQPRTKGILAVKEAGKTTILVLRR